MPLLFSYGQLIVNLNAFQCFCILTSVLNYLRNAKNQQHVLHTEIASCHCYLSLFILNLRHIRSPTGILLAYQMQGDNETLLYLHNAVEFSMCSQNTLSDLAWFKKL